MAYGEWHPSAQQPPLHTCHGKIEHLWGVSSALSARAVIQWEWGLRRVRAAEGTWTRALVGALAMAGARVGAAGVRCGMQTKAGQKKKVRTEGPRGGVATRVGGWLRRSQGGGGLGLTMTWARLTAWRMEACTSLKCGRHARATRSSQACTCGFCRRV